MPVATASLASVPKKELALDNTRLRGRLKRIKVEGARIGGNMASVAVGAATATGMGILMNKWPEARQIMGVETLLVAGGLMTLIGVWAKGPMSGAMQSMGEGMLYPWLFAYGNTTLAAKFG